MLSSVLATLCLLAVLYFKNRYGYENRKSKVFTSYPNQSIVYVGYSYVVSLPAGLPQGAETLVKRRLDDIGVLIKIEAYLQGGKYLEPLRIGDSRVSHLLSETNAQLRKTMPTKSAYELKNIDDALKQTIEFVRTQDFYRSIKFAEHAYELSK